MQALIDYDGWRKWKEFGSQSDTTDAAAKLSTSFSSIRPKKSTPSPTSSANPAGFGMPNGAITSASKAKEAMKERRRSIGPPTVVEEKETPPLEGLS
jgi:osomolarity two-component system, response regulator SSK1